MEIIALATMGAKYIVKLITGSKAFDTAKEDTLSKSWKWVKQHVFRNNPSLEEKVNNTAGDEGKEALLTEELKGLLAKDSFRKDFGDWIGSLRQDQSIKNFFGGDIDEIAGNVTIGDKGRVTPGEVPTAKNIVTGRIGKIGGDFQLGDVEG